MNELQEKKVLTLDSREVADMVEKRHDHLMRDIETYIDYLGQTPSLGSDAFFIESSYKAGTGKEYKCYLVTKKRLRVYCSQTHRPERSNLHSDIH
jgi:phage regulator Rha-like protein